MPFPGATLSGTGCSSFARKPAAIRPIDGSSVAAGGTLKAGVRPRHRTGFTPAPAEIAARDLAIATAELAIASASSAELATAAATCAAEVSGATAAELTSAAASTEAAAASGAASSTAEPSPAVGIRSYEEQCGKHSRSRQHSYGQSHGLIPFSKDAVHPKIVISNQ